ncbi:MAG TPA: branched-chain amino acid ABC transporter permease [Polyangiaceae bacterium]|nr:branched-chain amino acid ABC transporter permease [Polyangiaceae bacterium]
MGPLAGATLQGLAQGSMIALIALGYTMVYGVLGLINFAHGEVFMAAAFAGQIVLVGGAGYLPAPLAFAFALAAALAAALAVGLAVERGAYRPLLERPPGPGPRPSPLVTALAMSVLLQNVAVVAFGTRPRSYPQLDLPTQPLIVAAALAAMLALQATLARTWLGKAMRATAADAEAARLVGLRAPRVVAFTFALGSALAALGAVLYCLDQSQAYPTMGAALGTRAFAAAVLGGIGSVPGAVLGGLLLGLVGEWSKLTDYAGGQDVLSFAALVVVLLVRPTGLLGRRREEKV